MPVTEFPDQFPEAEIRLIASALTTRSIDRSLLLPAWVVQGYLEGLLAGPSPRGGSLTDAVPIADPEVAAKMVEVADAHAAGGRSGPLSGLIGGALAKSLALAVAKLVVRVLES